MTIIKKSLIAAAVLFAVQAQAAQYNVTGNLTATKVIGAQSTPTLTLTPGQPAFTSTWDINTATNTLIGGLDFNSYSVGIRALGGLISGTVNQSNAVYQIGGGAGNASYNAATRTLTVGQVMTYSNASGSSSTSLLWNTVANPDLGLSAAVSGTCSGNNLICDNQRNIFLANPNLERFYLSLTFDGIANGDGVNIFSHFTGTAVSVDVGNGTTGNSWTSYTFRGELIEEEVPLPAAAWLMGSGLLGLAGVARRRRSKD
jgi:hypothetical protein